MQIDKFCTYILSHSIIIKTVLEPIYCIFQCKIDFKTAFLWMHRHYQLTFCH